MTNEGQILKMKLCSVNLFAEFIMFSLGKGEKSAIEVVDFENFVVVKGTTTSSEIKDLNKLKVEFQEKFGTISEEIKIGNTIDLISYGVEEKKIDKMCFQFFNTKNLKLLSCNIDKTQTLLSIKSEFPYGYSFGMGKSLFNYAKHITYNLQTKYVWDKLTICISERNNEENFEIYLDTCDEPNEKLKSSILDAFNFNFDNLEKKFSESEWWKPIIDDENEFKFLKSLNENLIIF